MLHHSYADDMQIYIHCDNNENAIRRGIVDMQNCIADVCTWMGRNALKINEDKTEFIVFNSTTNTPSVSLHVGVNTVNSSDSIKVLGITLDSKMTLETQISNTCRASYMQMRKINSIRRYLSLSAVKSLVQSTLIVRLDYCNIIYTGLPQKSVRRLQLSHNSAARIITRTSRREHITPILIQLHWLPIIKRCQFKTCILQIRNCL